MCVYNFVICECLLIVNHIYTYIYVYIYVYIYIHTTPSEDTVCHNLVLNYNMKRV